MKNYETIIENINNSTAKEIEKIRNEYSENEIRLRTKIEELKNELVKLHDVATANEADVKKNADTEVDIIKSMIAAESEVKTAQTAFDDAAKTAIMAVENNAPDIMIIGAMSAKREAQSALSEAKKIAEELGEKVATITAKYEKNDENEVPTEVTIEANNVVAENHNEIFYSTEDNHNVIRQPEDGDVFTIFHKDGIAKISGIKDKYDVNLMFDKSIRDDINKSNDGQYRLYFRNEIRWGTLYITGFKPVKG